MKRLAVAVLTAAALAGPATAQSDLRSKLQSAGVPQATGDPASPGAPGGAATPPTPLLAAEPVYARRDGVVCGDFKRAEAGGWSVLQAVQLPGPGGPVKLVAGQVLGPGDYVGGLHLAAMLQRQCPGG